MRPWLFLGFLSLAPLLAACEEESIKTYEECVEAGGRVAIGPADDPECNSGEFEVGELTWAKCCFPVSPLD